MTLMVTDIKVILLLHLALFQSLKSAVFILPLMLWWLVAAAVADGLMLVVAVLVDIEHSHSTQLWETSQLKSVRVVMVEQALVGSDRKEKLPNLEQKMGLNKFAWLPVEVAAVELIQIQARAPLEDLVAVAAAARMARNKEIQ